MVVQNTEASLQIADVSKHRHAFIQGLRAIAVIAVVAYHAGLPMPGGLVGVDVFFVISGFVITQMLHREFKQTGRIDFWRFYRRRFQRLAPALALMVTVTLLVSILILSPFGTQQTVVDTAIGSVLFVANFVIALSTGGYFELLAESNPLLNVWSLSVEEQFYFAFPVILFITWKISRSGRKVFQAPVLIVAGLAILSFVISIASSTGLAFPGSGLLFGFYSPLTRAWEFALGSILAISIANRDSASSRMQAASGLAGAALLALSFWLITERTPFPGVWTLLPVTGTLLLIFAGRSQKALSTRWLSKLPLVKTGDWSYSIYLWHWPFIVFAATVWPDSVLALVIASVVSLVPAVASFVWIETPLRAMSFRGRRNLVTFIGLTLAIPLACAAFVGVGSKEAWWLAWPSTNSGENAHVAYESCTDKSFNPDKCTWNGALDKGNVLLVGDSQAYALADGVIDAASSLKLSTTVSSKSACPFIENGYLWQPEKSCEDWQVQLIDYAIRTQPSVVVIANRSSGYVNKEWGWVTLSKNPEGSPATSSIEAAKIWEQAILAISQRLRAEGIGVLVINPIPDVNNRADSGGGATIIRDILGWTAPDMIQATRAQAEQARELALKAEQAASSNSEGPKLFDPIPVLCDLSECPKFKNGESLYLDWGHLTREGAILLSPALRIAIQEAVIKGSMYD